ncbi:PREDICTED: tektin-4 [Condylura cristata]|uniref:tektin-4 n=1 Tax=Condylura cristata TaxID=143302 RepID=UPI0006430320|nr:PREDICTED: tektin-4 [Condylura cristata]
MVPPDVLLTKPPAPQTVPAHELPRKEHEVARNTGAHTSAGLATAGFRTAKYLEDEWCQGCYARYYQAFADRDGSERLRHESGRRLQGALDAVASPLAIATDNLQSRERRQHPDLVRDPAELELLKEAELIRNIQELLKRTIVQAMGQIRLNREHKETCEMNWSDKVEAYNIDEACTRLHNQSPDARFHPHSAVLEESASTPESWAKFTQEILSRAERERLASVNLRALIDCILRDTAEDLRLQSDAVNLALGRRCEELEDSRLKLEHHLHKTLREITEQEHNVAALKQAIKDKEAPLRVAQTRLYQRSFRPNVELCRDAAQFRGGLGRLLGPPVGLGVAKAPCASSLGYWAALGSTGQHWAALPWGQACAAAVGASQCGPRGRGRSYHEPRWSSVDRIP